MDDSDATDIIERMRGANADDKHSLDNGQPALKKLQIIDEIDTKLSIRSHHQRYIDFGLLSELSAWLTPYKNNLPTLKVRNTILQILGKFDIKADSHMSIVNALRNLTKNTKETNENKRQATNLIKKWSSPTISYKREKSSNSSEKKKEKKKNKQPAPQIRRKVSNPNPGGLMDKLKNLNRTQIRKKLPQIWE